MRFLHTIASSLVALAVVVLVTSAARAAGPPSFPDRTAPSSMQLQDYEKQVLLPWLQARKYEDWESDANVRDTGPFIARQNLGTHPAVRIFYSHEVVTWLKGDRQGEIPDGAVIVKEMFHSPAAIYESARQHAFLAENPDKFEELLVELLTGWAVMIKDRGGESVDGWFWSGPGVQGDKSRDEWLKANADDYSHVFYSGFGLGTCIRCHASAEKESTFSDLKNIEGKQLEFRVDNSWRSKEGYLDCKEANVYTIIKDFLEEHKDPDPISLLATYDLEPQQQPWTGRDSGECKIVDEHVPGTPKARVARSRPDANPAFVEAFGSFPGAGTPESFTLPFQWADHVYPHPAADGRIDDSSSYVTSNNCMGCHGGLGGPPFAVSMFVQTGPGSGTGYNISEYGEWRWSPMGLAGRDPVFFAQFESELILLLKNGGKLGRGGPDPKNPLTGTVEQNQKALANTCLSCHGAMGQRQLQLDAEAGRKLPSGAPLNADFNPDYFYLVQALTEADKTEAEAQNELASPPRPTQPLPIPAYSYDNKGDFYGYHRYGELAREGISCAVCHHIAAPGSTEEGRAKLQAFVERAGRYPNWLPVDADRKWLDDFVYFLAENTTGQYERGPADELYGPFNDVTEKPMEHALGIAPVRSAPMKVGLAPEAKRPTSFTADSSMCGTCHTINLPNIGEPEDEYPILTQLENNPALSPYPHSIEQATYLEWLNSAFGPGRDNKVGPEFQSCQDCHMPRSFKTRDGSVHIDPLVSQIASIQDSTYPEAENAISQDDLDVPLRDNYRRHELVGLNGFLVEMAQQFPDILGVATTDYETGADSGSELAIESMLLSAEEGRVVTLDVGTPVIVDEKLEAVVTVTNQTGHRFPSGVSFRRAFIEFAVHGKDGGLLWASGQPNAAGLITRTDGKTVLPTEFLDRKASRGDVIAQYQPHYQTISDDSEVQIYEELVTNANNEFTTSFIHRVTHVKDNRLLPRGWIPAKQFAEYDPATEKFKQGRVLYEFMKATNPEGASVIGEPEKDPNGRSWEPDPEYSQSPSPGADSITYAIPLSNLADVPASVTVTVHSQALMPAWLHQRFKIAREAKAAGRATPEADRLYYITSRLNLDGSAMEGWTLPVVSESVAVAAGSGRTAK